MKERLIIALQKAGFSAYLNDAGNIVTYYPAAKKEVVDFIILAHTAKI